MRVLFVAAEVAPFSKTGGLGDVAGALPAALAARGVEVCVVSPLYAHIPRASLTALPQRLSLRFPFGTLQARLWRSALSPFHDRLFVDNADLYGRAGIYGEDGVDYADSPRRYAFLSLAALEAAEQLGWSPDIVHLNDWHTGLAALALRRGYRTSSIGHARTVFTIHNLAYQGVAPKSVMDELGLPWEEFTPDGLEFFGQVSFLKAGLVYSDRLTTVSRRYAEEICTPEKGWGMDGLLRQRRASLTGILNGVDYAEWSPSSDPHLAASFEPGRLTGKRRCKEALLQGFGLDRPGALDAPLFGIVSRLVPQKGIDLLLEALPRVLDRPMSFVAVGTGEPLFEQGLLALAAEFPRKVAVRIGFDEAWAHQVEAASDFFVMPSRFEPCGLNQMYSLRYGAVPIVRATGGLDDTVVDAALPRGTGIKFMEPSPAALTQALERALALWSEPGRMDALRGRGMVQDFSWDEAASRYEDEYRLLAPGAEVPKSLSSARKRK
jgi:starch synthase